MPRKMRQRKTKHTRLLEQTTVIKRLLACCSQFMSFSKYHFVTLTRNMDQREQLMHLMYIELLKKFLEIFSLFLDYTSLTK